MKQSRFFPLSASAILTICTYAQGTAGSLTGVVTDTTGALIPNATVSIENALSGFKRSVTADSAGRYTFANVPFNRYHVSATATGFAGTSTDVQVRNALSVAADLKLAVGASDQVVTVEADDLRDTGALQTTTVDRALFDKLPLQQTSSPLSSLVTLSTPGIASDSNGLFHPLGEHADTTFAIDGQPISDQQSRVFGNQISTNIIQSVNVIEGIAPPEYGDKSSLVVQTTTRSGIGLLKPTGTIGYSYGTFGTSVPSIAIGSGTEKVGNFVSFDGLRSSRYLDSPEYVALHDQGNNESFFDRLDYRPEVNNFYQLNLSFSRSWFQQPDQYDQISQDQRGQIFSYNIAPSWTHIFDADSLLNVSPYLRQDNFHYYPSHNVFHDTPVTLQQSRRLQNAGIKTDYSISHGIHNIKAGGMFYHTFLQEGFGLGVTDPTYNAPCLDSNGNAVTDPSLTDPAQCAAAGDVASPAFRAGLAQYDLTRGGSLFVFKGRTDIKQEALYLQDNVTWKKFNLMAGVRADNYDGISRRSEVEPRLNLSYDLSRSSTVFRLGYGRFFLTPYNENLIVSSSTGIGGLEGASYGDVPLKPASRDQYDAGFQQSFGKYLVLDGEYFWKYTDRDFDFDVVLNTPLAFPIQWDKSKIDGFGIKLTVPNYRGFTAYSVLGHTRSRFFGPEVGGVLFNDPTVKTAYVFRIDHDQAFQQSTHGQYQFRQGPYFGMTWRYESGLVTDASRDPKDDSYVLNLSADQQAQIALSCGNIKATLAAPVTNCAADQIHSPLLRIPALGTENDDKNPPRIAPRTLFDLQLGEDNILRRDKLHTNVSVSVTNLTNKYALYNFLSTFSGTHFVAPRQVTGTVNFTF